MPNIETKIWLALKLRIQSIPGGLPIAYPASVYSPGASSYIAVGRVSAAPRRIYMERGKNVRTGTLTISHVAPLGQDLAFYENVAAAIASHFQEDDFLSFDGVCVQITSAPHVVEGFRDDAWWRTPVNIPWLCAA